MTPRGSGQLPSRRIADELRRAIATGELRPGDKLPSERALADQYGSARNTAREAIRLLSDEALVTAEHGRGVFVRTPPQRITRSSDRHQLEKTLAAKPEPERRRIGAAETDLGISLDLLRPEVTYAVSAASPDLAALFEVRPGARLLERKYETFNRETGLLMQSSTSYLPYELVEPNPDLLTSDNEPWPGGTLHQLSTVGVEVMEVVDQVTAATPDVATVSRWGLPDGVPMLRVRRLSYDTEKRLVEVSDADYPADRTLLEFRTSLKKWRRWP